MSQPHVPATNSLPNRSSPDEEASRHSASSTKPSTQKPGGLIWLEGILGPVFEVSIFGGSITFSVIVSNLPEPRRFGGQLDTFLALAWFFFVLALGVATAARLALSFNEGELWLAFALNERLIHGEEQIRKAKKKLAGQKLLRFVFIKAKLPDILCTLILLAFFFLSLCVAAYNVAIGSLAAASTGILTLVFAWTFGQTLYMDWRKKSHPPGAPLMQDGSEQVSQP